RAADPRRADQWPGPGRHGRDARVHPLARPRRPHGPAVEPPDGGDRADERPRGRDPRRLAHRRGHGRRAARPGRPARTRRATPGGDRARRRTARHRHDHERRRRDRHRRRLGRGGRHQPRAGRGRHRRIGAVSAARIPRRRLPGADEMTRMITAELLVLRKRAATWILLGLWTLLGVFFAYVIPYALDPEDAVGDLNELLPQSLAGNLTVGFPFFGGVFALMLGVFATGSEYGWDMLKT